MNQKHYEDGPVGGRTDDLP